MQANLNLKKMLEAGGKIVLSKSSDGTDIRKLHFGLFILHVNSDAEVHMSFSNVDDPVPNDLLPFIVDFTEHDNFGYGLNPRRQLGQYRLGTAVCDLLTAGGGHYHNRLRAKKQKDLCGLMSLVRQGQVWPAKDYEVEQVPPPYRHLRNLISEAWQLVRRDVRDRLYRIKERVAH